ncbi:resuscitation-promoting factor, partial [Rhodococcus sp. NPDC003382]
MSALSKINSSRSTLLYAVVGALLLTLIAGAATAVARHKTITVNVDGELVALATMRTDVRGVRVGARRDRSPRPPPGTTVLVSDVATNIQHT